MDIVALVGSIMGVGLILIGQAMEGGSAAELMQVTAALIVFGGTAGAVVLSFPGSDLKNSVKFLKTVYFNEGGDQKKVIA